MTPVLWAALRQCVRMTLETLRKQQNFPINTNLLNAEAIGCFGRLKILAKDI